jgi:signal transduction histidine kinase/CheY-like chemotaxis protein
LVLCAAVAVESSPDFGPIGLRYPPDSMQGEGQIWQIAQEPTGQIIVGGSRIGFRSDNTWLFLPQPKVQAVRALVISGKTLWVAATGEIGRLPLPLTSTSEYEALDIPEIKNIGDIWHIHADGDGLVATSKEDVWFIDPHRRTAHNIHLPNTHRLYLFEFRGQLLVTQPGVRIWRVVNGAVEPFQNPLPDKSDTIWIWCDDNLVLTSRHLYKWDGKQFCAITDIADLNKGIITSASRLGDTLAVATFTEGLALVDTDSGAVRFVPRGPQLSTLAILSTFADAQGLLWIGTQQKGPTVFQPRSIGEIAALPEAPAAALWTPSGLILNFEDRAELVAMDGSSSALPHLWAMANTSHGLACGLWGLTRIGPKDFPTPGNFVGSITELRNGHFIAVCAVYAYDINFETGVVRAIENLPNDSHDIIDHGGRLWAATLAGDVLTSPDSPPYEFSKLAAGPPGVDLRLRAFGNEVLATNTEGILVLPSRTVPTHAKGVRNPRIAVAGGDTWLLAEQEGNLRLGRLTRQGSDVVWNIVSAKGLSAMRKATAFTGAQRVLTICSDSEILNLNPETLHAPEPPTAPVLRFLGPKIDEQTRIPFGAGTIRFTSRQVHDDFEEPTQLQYRLLPTESAWITSDGSQPIAFPSLSPNRYVLEVRAAQYGNVSGTISYPFTLLQPWYLTPMAFAGCVAAILALGYAAYLLRTRQIREHSANLEELVRQRTQDLEKASAAKSEFLASMSHEIRNPMNGVVGLIDILAETPGNPKQAGTLRMLHYCADQLRNTVDDILDFSRIEAGEVELHSSSFNLRETLEAAAGTVDITRRQIAFSEPVPDIVLRGDPSKLRQIFANFLNNALKYGVPPSARIQVLLTPAGERTQVTIAVASSGPTIPKETLNRLFESFTRGEDAKQRNIRGNGLGLAICKRYAEAMGGNVGAVSENGETTFYLTAPFEGSAAKVSDERPQAKSSLPARALAIEDEDYNRVVLGHILKLMNYTVDWATTGAEALRLAQENGYDIILTDYKLPDTNGVALAKAILAGCPEPKPAVFAVTAYSTKERRLECMAAGMAGFITKPITLEKLHQAFAVWGESRLTRISPEVAPKKAPPSLLEIQVLWQKVLESISSDPAKAASLAHRLNNLCRANHRSEVADQLELLEGALEAGRPIQEFVDATQRLLPGVQRSEIVTKPFLSA